MIMTRKKKNLKTVSMHENILIIKAKIFRVSPFEGTHAQVFKVSFSNFFWYHFLVEKTEAQNFLESCSL
jgi:hypothetical protein